MAAAQKAGRRPSASAMVGAAAAMWAVTRCTESSSGLSGEKPLYEVCEDGHKVGPILPGDRCGHTLGTETLVHWCPAAPAGGRLRADP
jgi:hypothetical protein